MSKILCATTDCKHNQECKCMCGYTVCIHPVSNHTLHNMWRKYWVCDHYEMSDEYKEKLNILGGNIRGTYQKENL